MISHAIRIGVAALALIASTVAAPEAAMIGKTPLAEWLAKWRAGSKEERAALLDPFGSQEVPNREAWRQIPELLHAPDAATRELACDLLIYDRDDASELLPRLVVAVKDAEVRVRFAAARALEQLAWDVEQHGPSFMLAMDELIAVANGKDAELQRAALQCLYDATGIEPRLVPLYAGFLKASDVELRRIAAYGLLSSAGEHEEARPPLREALGDADATVRSYATRGLVAAGENSDELAAVLMGLASDPDTSVRSMAVLNLGDLGVERAAETLPILVNALGDGDAFVRGQAASAIGNLANSDNVDVPDAAPRLVELAKDENAYVRSAVAWALGHIGATAQLAVPALATLIEDPVPAVRNYALASLEQAGGDVALALPQLTAALKHPDAGVRAWVAKLIGLGGDRSLAATDALIERLADPSLPVRIWSAYALREIGPQAAGATTRLVQALAEDPEPKLRVEAARALAAFGPLAGSGVDALVASCRDPELDVRLWSLFALGEVKVRSDAVVATLKSAAQAGDARVVAEANKALEKLGEEHDERAIANAPGAPPIVQPLAAPISYDGLALVLVDAKGAALVTFFDETHVTEGADTRDGVKYRHRYLAKGQTEATTGEGEAFAVSHAITPGFGVEDASASHSFVDAGPLRVAWSYRKAGSAFVYWRPEALTVTLASALDFETLDLRRFLR